MVISGFGLFFLDLDGVMFFFPYILLTARNFFYGEQSGSGCDPDMGRFSDFAFPHWVDTHRIMGLIRKGKFLYTVVTDWCWIQCTASFADTWPHLVQISHYCSVRYTCMEDNQRASSWISAPTNLDANSLLAINKELIGQLDSSLMFWEKIFLDVTESLPQPTESMELVETTSYAPSPCISYTQLNLEVGGNNSEIDMNLEPTHATVSEVQTPAEEQMATDVRTGVNDVFWEQFLTENPGSNDSSGLPTDKKDAPGMKSENKPGEYLMHWWNKNSVNNLAEQLGHLMPAERT